MTRTDRVPPVLRAAHVRRTPDEAFALFTESIGAWWPLRSHGLYGVTGTLLLLGGRLVEHAPDGQQSLWASVTAWEPPRRLVLQWHPGAELEDASELEVLFLGDDDGTRVEIVHRGWERFGEQARQRRSGYARPNAWGYVLDHYTHLADAEAPEAGRAEALAELAAAYAEFYDEAERGGFGAPPAGAWDATGVVAHVALHDMALAAVTRGLIDGTPVSFDDAGSQRPDHLAALSDACGDLAGLVELGRAQARITQLITGRLDDQQAATEVHCRQHQDDQLVLDEPLPWFELAVTREARSHLPRHLEQLRSLRR